MNELQVIISNPAEGGFLKEISWNREEFKGLVEKLLANYKDTVYTDDQVDVMKKDRAVLNAAKKEISDRRIQVKKAVMAPYEKFEAEVKEISGEIDLVIGKIDDQVKRIENDKKAKKRQQMEDFFVGISDGLDPEITFERIFDQRYLNTTYALSKCLFDIKAKVDDIKAVLASIEKMDAEDRIVAKSVYLKTLNEHAAMEEMYRQQKIRKEMQEAEKQETGQEQAQNDAGEVSGAGCDKITVEDEKIQQSATEGASEGQPVIEEPKKYLARFAVIGTKDQLNALRRWIDENGLEIQRA